jgi:hypothetical protein
VDRRALLAGMLAAVPFTASVALLCATSIDDPLFRTLSSAGLFGLYAALMALQAVIGLAAYRGAALARPLATVTGAFMLGAVAVLLLGDVAVRIVKPGFLPAGPVDTAIVWAAVLAPLLFLAAMCAVTVAVAVGAARARLQSGQASSSPRR